MRRSNISRWVCICPCSGKALYALSSPDGDHLQAQGSMSCGGVRWELAEVVDDLLAKLAVG